MGFAKFLGRDYGTTYTKGDRALGIFLFWLIGGLIISFAFSMIFLPEPNFEIPIIIYFVGLGFFIWRYLKIDRKSKK